MSHNFQLKTQRQLFLGVQQLILVTLAEALTVAFDTTVTGLVIGALAYLVSKFKKQWYESDLIVLETIAEAELETLNRK